MTEMLLDGQIRVQLCVQRR